EFAKVGIKRVDVSPALRAEFIKIAAQPVWDEWVKKATEKGYPGQELLDLILDTAKAAQG
ncbi:MAG: C4-dicarboxylate ABC transporter substrate-binding protein, partial [Alphaproteobacteria bacterium]